PILPAYHRHKKPNPSPIPFNPPRSRPPASMKAGSKLRQWRKQYALTTDQLADLIGYAVGTIENVERNALDPSLTMLRALAELYGVSLSQLLEDAE
ncbi:MAG TPA: helix-turn-helix transcriptional regulator, partial [Ktedonobacterales bacterium]|nr:helix-turn-helix transcriptional regulator [Ktedonobacterales bacterium]